MGNCTRMRLPAMLFTGPPWTVEQVSGGVGVKKKGASAGKKSPPGNKLEQHIAAWGRSIINAANCAAPAHRPGVGETCPCHIDSAKPCRAKNVPKGRHLRG